MPELEGLEGRLQPQSDMATDRDGRIERGPMLVLRCPAGHPLFLMNPNAKPGALWKCSGPGCGGKAYALPPTLEARAASE